MRRFAQSLQVVGGVIVAAGAWVLFGVGVALVVAGALAVGLGALLEHEAT